MMEALIQGSSLVILFFFLGSLNYQGVWMIIGMLLFCGSLFLVRVIDPLNLLGINTYQAIIMEVFASVYLLGMLLFQPGWLNTDTYSTRVYDLSVFLYQLLINMYIIQLIKHLERYCGDYFVGDNSQLYLAWYYNSWVASIIAISLFFVFIYVTTYVRSLHLMANVNQYMSDDDFSTKGIFDDYYEFSTNDDKSATTTAATTTTTTTAADAMNEQNSFMWYQEGGYYLLLLPAMVISVCYLYLMYQRFKVFVLTHRIMHRSRGLEEISAVEMPTSQAFQFQSVNTITQYGSNSV